LVCQLVQSRNRLCSLSKLMPQGHDLQGQLVLGMEPAQKVAQEHGDNREHIPLACGQFQQNQRLRSVTTFLPPTGS
jgi:hypothetical protein